MPDASNKLRCRIITPDARTLDLRVYDLILPAHDGLRGILPGHASMLCQLQMGLLHYQQIGNDIAAVFLEGGFAHIHNDEITVLTTAFITRKDISRGSAEQILLEAQALPQHTIEENEFRNAAVTRARLLISLFEPHHALFAH